MLKYSHGKQEKTQVVEHMPSMCKTVIVYQLLFLLSHPTALPEKLPEYIRAKSCQKWL